jgi:hypothetical protein
MTAYWIARANKMKDPEETFRRAERSDPSLALEPPGSRDDISGAGRPWVYFHSTSEFLGRGNSDGCLFRIICRREAGRVRSGRLNRINEPRGGINAQAGL